MLYFPDSARGDFLPSRGVIYSTFIITFALLTSQVKTNSNLVLLTASLRTFQKHACDGEELRVECPPGTIISISVAQYGRPFLPSYSGGGEPCPPEEDYKWKKGGDPGCLANNALTVIEETCREQRVCRLWTSPETFQEDPCPSVRKFAEVAYKCRPDQFTNRVVCEGDRLRLHCNAGYRIVIFSAMFGSVKTGVIECPQPSGVDDDDCAVSFSTENAIRVCGGRRKCSLAADVDSFGSPLCNPRTRKHLKVTWTCVPQEVVTPSSFGIDYEEEDGNLGDSIRPDYPLMTDDLSRKRGGTDASRLVTSNKEKLILYVTVSLGVGLIVFLSVVGIKLFHLRVLSRNKHNVSKSQEQFPDDNSDCEPDERPPSRHPSRISVRRQDSDVQPRTPVTSDANHYYV